MKIALSTGTAQLRITHSRPQLGEDGRMTPNQPRRFTKVELEIPLSSGRSQHMEEYAYCSDKDNFCRRVGRKVAMKKAMETGGYFLDTLDRRKLWQAALPEYFRSR